MALVPALTLLASALSSSSACESVLQEHERGLSAFLRLVDLYRDGKRDEAVEGLSHLKPGEADRLIGGKGQALEEDQKASSSAMDHCVRAASLLETELGMKWVSQSRWKEADASFNEAWKLANALESNASGKQFQRDWLLAAGLFYQGQIALQDPGSAFYRADSCLREAARKYPDDVEVLLAAGAVLEFSGSLREGLPSDLREAEKLYARSVQLEKDNAEANLRLGWVLKKLRKYDEAAVHLHRVLDLSSDPHHIYRSRMALGALAETAGRLSEAASHYEAATRAEPAWQIGYIAWSHALHAAGSHSRAREILEKALGTNPAAERLDGWWRYELGLAPRLDSLLERMRAEVRS